MSRDILVTQFDTHLLRTKPECLHALADLYCRIFSLDPNFGEYRKCPTCKQYFNYEQVENDGVRDCQNDHPKVAIVPAWEPDKVGEEILHQSEEEGFFGAQVTLNGEIVGFAYVRYLSLKQIGEEWGDSIVKMIKPVCSGDQVIYFDELGVDIKSRRIGLGKELVRFICRWARENHPEKMTILRTHYNSPARGIFEGVGYRKFADDTEYGGGRIMMKVDKCYNLRPAYLRPA
jgi:ribosomal protein S18 acetylase RimI-like enzyme